MTSRLTMLTLPNNTRWVWSDMPSVTGYQIKCVEHHAVGPFAMSDNAMEDRWEDTSNHSYWQITTPDGEDYRLSSQEQRYITRETLEQFCAQGCPSFQKRDPMTCEWHLHNPTYWDVMALLGMVGAEAGNPWPDKLERALRVACGAMLCAGLWSIAAGLSAIARGGLL
jgi:hypothetical protein